MGLGRYNIPGHIYLMLASDGWYRIGRTINLKLRRQQHASTFSLDFTLIHSIWVPDMCEGERRAHRMFKHRCERPNWGKSEWFQMQPTDVRKFKRLTTYDICTKPAGEQYVIRFWCNACQRNQNGAYDLWTGWVYGPGHIKCCCERCGAELTRYFACDADVRAAAKLRFKNRQIARGSA